MDGASVPGTLESRLEALEALRSELDGYLKRCKKVAATGYTVGGSHEDRFEEVFNHAFRLRAASAPVTTSHAPDGRPVSTLPAGFSMPCPVNKDILEAAKHHGVARRVHPPVVEARFVPGPTKATGELASVEAARSPGSYWELTVYAPEGVHHVFYTLTGDSPDYKGPNTKRLDSATKGRKAKLKVRPGALVKFAGATVKFRRSEIITFQAPKADDQAINEAAALTGRGVSSYAATKKLEELNIQGMRPFEPKARCPPELANQPPMKRLQARRELEKKQKLEQEASRAAQAQNQQPQQQHQQEKTQQQRSLQGSGVTAVQQQPQGAGRRGPLPTLPPVRRGVTRAKEVKSSQAGEGKSQGNHGTEIDVDVDVEWESEQHLTPSGGEPVVVDDEDEEEEGGYAAMVVRADAH
mmetsp:Transcript_1976/g.4279  ORF Transcript_1976/g.4279 Transcript_1976/m.4279 type:complete len:411 (+) Transcript_1976:53-1285(+)